MIALGYLEKYLEKNQYIIFKKTEKKIWESEMRTGKYTEVTNNDDDLQSRD